MKRSKFSEEQIIYALRQADSGTPSAMSVGNSASPSKPFTPGKRNRPISASANSVGSDSWKRSTAG